MRERRAGEDEFKGSVVREPNKVGPLFFDFEDVVGSIGGKKPIKAGVTEHVADAIHHHDVHGAKTLCHFAKGFAGDGIGVEGIGGEELFHREEEEEGVSFKVFVVFRAGLIVSHSSNEFLSNDRQVEFTVGNELGAGCGVEGERFFSRGIGGGRGGVGGGGRGGGG